MTTPARALVKNAADPDQVATGGRLEEERARLERADLLSVLSTKIGRRVLWRVLTRCGVFKSIYETSARIHYNAGQQDLGHWLMNEILEVDAAAYLVMQQESQTRAKKDDETTEAAQTPSVLRHT